MGGANNPVVDAAATAVGAVGALVGGRLGTWFWDLRLPPQAYGIIPASKRDNEFALTSS
jgi:hypothetical protein